MAEAPFPALSPEPREELTEAQQDRQQALKQASVDAQEDGNLDLALEKMTKAICVGAATAMMYSRRAQLLLQLGRLGAVINDCTAALKVNPDSAKAFKLRARAYMKQQQWEKAHADFAQALKIDYDEDTAEASKGAAVKVNELKAAAVAQRNRHEADEQQRQLQEKKADEERRKRLRTSEGAKKVEEQDRKAEEEQRKRLRKSEEEEQRVQRELEKAELENEKDEIVAEMDAAKEAEDWVLHKQLAERKEEVNNKLKVETGGFLPNLTLVMETGLGQIKMRIRPNAAPETCKHVIKLVEQGLYNNCCFYQTSHVKVQCGLWRPDGSAAHNPYPDLKVNETALHQRMSNIRGMVAMAHSDAPDNGNGEFFINLQSNPQFDTESGGFCVFAEVVEEASFRVADAICAALLKGTLSTVPIKRMVVDTGLIFRWTGGGIEPRPF